MESHHRPHHNPLPRAGEGEGQPIAQRLLQVWDEQQHAHSTQRMLYLLEAVWPGKAWLHASIGARDNALMHLHERLFGGQLSTTTACPHCGERLESHFRTSDVRSGESSPPAGALRFEQLDYSIDYRLPDSADLLALASATHDADVAARRLMRRCVSRARLHGTDVDAVSLPGVVVESLGVAMAEHDPDADVRIALVCPACSAAWHMRFDIVSYLWSELDDWAQRLLADVHLLARAYGWSEDAILALGPTRRRMYLDMVAA